MERQQSPSLEKTEKDSTSEKRGFLITLCGAGGTGKTTVSEGFRQTDIGQTFVSPPSAARKVSKEWGIKSEDEQADLNMKEFFDFQKAITQTYVDDINGLIAEDKRVIADRSMIDHVAYSHMKWVQRRAEGMDHGWWDDSSEALACELLDFQNILAMRELAKVDILGFFPYGVFQPPKEQYRTNSDVERRTVDGLMRGFIWRFKSDIEIPLAEFRVKDPVTRILHLEHFAGKLLGIEIVGRR